MQINVNACFPFNTEWVIGLVEGVRQPRNVNKKVRLMCHAVKVYFCHLARTQVKSGRQQAIQRVGFLEEVFCKDKISRMWGTSGVGS